MKLSWGMIWTFLGVALLIGLGVWQIQRAAWKEDMLARITSQMTAEPLDLSALPPDQLPAQLSELDYRRVKLHGHFLHDLGEAPLGPRTYNGQVGWHIITPFEAANGRIWLVNRGWVPDDRRDPASRSESWNKDEVILTGIARLPAAPGPFTPANDPATDHWYWYDLPAMIRAVEMQSPPLMEQILAAAETRWVIEADATSPQGALPQGGITTLNIPNNHRHYALTWFTLAAVLLVFFVVAQRRV